MSAPPSRTPTHTEISRTLNAVYDAEQRFPFVLSLDGGGVYGLTAAIWLRQLCERTPSFLVPGQVRVFTGCSSGAINSLLLAQHDSPREAVLAGELDRFWTGTGIFSNQSPLTRALSGQSLTAMFGTEDFLEALHDEFGDLTLGELKHRVLISAYNWTGAPAHDQHFGTPFDGPIPDLTTLRPEHMFRMTPPAPLRSRGGQTRMHWRPKFFDSHGLHTTDSEMKVVDIAYAAACVPGLRALRGGIGDGASFNANPSIGAIAHILREWELCVEYGLEMDEVPKGIEGVDGGKAKRSPREEILRVIHDGIDDDVNLDDKLADKEWVKSRGKGVVLSWMRILSLGSGQALPSLGYANLEVGLDRWQRLPTNPFDGVMLPTNLFALDAPATAAEYVCKRLLDEDRSMRLNPDLMPIPTVMASMMALNPMMRAYITQMIREKTASPKSTEAVGYAAEFLEEQGSFGTGWYVANEELQADYRDKLATWQAAREARTQAREEAKKAANPWEAWMRLWQDSVENAKQPHGT